MRGGEGRGREGSCMEGRGRSSRERRGGGGRHGDLVLLCLVWFLVEKKRESRFDRGLLLQLCSDGRLRTTEFWFNFQLFEFFSFFFFFYHFDCKEN